MDRPIRSYQRQENAKDIKLYMTVIRPVLIYGAECWTVRKKEEQILEKTEMRMLRRIKGDTLRDKVKCVDIRKQLGVTSLQEKVREMTLRWYDTCRDWKKTVVDMIVLGKRPRGRPRARPRGIWMDCVRKDIQALRITPEDAQDRTF